MTGRRQHPRYLLADPADGQLRVREEVVIERWDGSEIQLVSSEPCRRDERLTLELPFGSNGRIQVTVVESRPFLTVDEIVRHRVRLLIDPASEAAAPQGRQAL